MYVLGELINLEPEIRRAKKRGRHEIVRLPIPWYQRAPLGLLSGTTVHVAILEDPGPEVQEAVPDSGAENTESTCTTSPASIVTILPTASSDSADSSSGETLRKRRPRIGDIVVSVVNPMRHVFRVQVKRQEQQGALHEVFKKIHDLFNKHRINIALAETVTTDCRKSHDVTLVCEFLNQVAEATIKETKAELENLLSDGSIQEESEPLVVWQRPLKNIVFSRLGVIRAGWVCDCDWYSQIEPRTDASNSIELKTKVRPTRSAAARGDLGGRFDCRGFDCSRVVVYSDQANRVARFVLPKPNAFTVQIEHADIPGALEILTNSLKEEKLNLLSTLIRRGGAGHGNATLVAVCEPSSGEKKGVELLTVDLTEALRRVEDAAMYRIGDPRVSFGKLPSNILTLRHPEDRIIQVPKRLREAVKSIRDEIPLSCIPAFISRRFAGSGYRAKKIARIVHRTLRKNKFAAIEARPDPLDDNPTTFDQVEARLWASDLGIVLVINQENIESMSGNLAHEAGFLQGQDKPVVFLVEQSLARQNVIERNLSNIQGHVVLTFADGDSAYDPDNPNSIYQVLSAWLKNVRRRLREKKHRV
jgi:hypothetical protein